MSASGGPSVAYLLADPGIPVGGTKGASVHVESLCCAMACSGVRVRLYAARVAGPLRSRGAEGVDVVPVDVGEVRSGSAGEPGRISAARRFFDLASEHLSSERPDWVHERLTLFAGQGGDMCASLGLGRVVEVNAPVAAERSRHFGLLRDTAAHEAECSALTGARVLAVSPPLARWAVANGASEATVVPNGADTSAFAPAAWRGRRAELRRRLGLEGRVVVGFAGSLKPWHGVSVLVEAVADAAAAGKRPLGLLVVGDGPGRGDAEAATGLLPRSVRAVLAGAVPFALVPGYLAAMDVSVAPYLPSDDFYFSPLKVAEAMAAGRPVVASDFPPVSELLGGTGVLVAPGDRGCLANAVADLAADPRRRIELGGKARARAVEHLDWSAVSRRTLDFAAAGAGAGSNRG